MRANVRITKRSTKIMLLLSMYGALFLFMANTNPHDLSAWLLIAPVILLFGCLFFTLYWLPYTGKTGLGLRRVAVAAIIAGTPCIVLLLRSMGQLTGKDVLLMAVFGGMTFVYADRIKFSHKRQV